MKGITITAKLHATQFSYHHECDLLRFSKTRQLWSLKAAFTIAFFAALNHNYYNKERTLKNRKPLEIQQLRIITFWTCSSKLLFPKRSTKMIDGSEERKRQLALDFIIRVFLKGAVKYESGQCKTDCKMQTAQWE